MYVFFFTITQNAKQTKDKLNHPFMLILVLKKLTLQLKFKSPLNYFCALLIVSSEKIWLFLIIVFIKNNLFKLEIGRK